jgi:putative component of toxin-antitoxin plasmid stabilization module
VKWFAGIGEYVIDWGPDYRIYLAQADIERAKALHAEYKKRKR